jgi:hypothetical protein
MTIEYIVYHLNESYLLLLLSAILQWLSQTKLKKGVTSAIAHLKTFTIFRGIGFFINVLVLFGFALLRELYRNKWKLQLALYKMDQFMITYRHKKGHISEQIADLAICTDGGSCIAHSSPVRRPYRTSEQQQRKSQAPWINETLRNLKRFYLQTEKVKCQEMTRRCTRSDIIKNEGTQRE